jgi:hypothetical protein
MFERQPMREAKRLISVTQIPRNRMSKVLKNDLRQAYRDLFIKQLN